MCALFEKTEQRLHIRAGGEQAQKIGACAAEQLPVLLHPLVEAALVIPPESRIGGIDPSGRTRFGVGDPDQANVGQLAFPRVPGMKPDTIVPLGENAQGGFKIGSYKIRQDKTNAAFAQHIARVLQRPAQVGATPRRLYMQQLRMIRRVCWRPFEAG
jgi:hypothetical protein